MFLTEQKQNMGCIKESKNVCSRGVNLQVTFNVQYSKLICRHGCEDILYQAALTLRLKRGEKYGLIFMNMPTQLDCDQEKQRRLETVKKNSLEISLQVCYWYWYSNCRESKHADTRTLLRNRARIWPKNVKKEKEEANSLRSIRGVYLCVTACMKRRRDRQKEKNAISVRFLQTEDLGHLKEYGWISNTAATAELNLLNSPEGGDRVRKRGKEEMSEGERTQNGKRRWAGEGMGEMCGVGGMKQKERLREGREEIKQ